METVELLMILAELRNVIATPAVTDEQKENKRKAINDLHKKLGITEPEEPE